MSPRPKAASSTDLAYVDTNAIVALFAGGSHTLHEPALALFRRVADGQLSLILTPVVVAELVYVATGALGWSRSVAVRRMTDLLDAHGLIVKEGRVVARALGLLSRSKRLDFPDAYLASLALDMDRPALASFDRDLDTVPGLRRVTA